MYINIKQPLEVLVRMSDKVLSIRAENPAVAIVDIRVLEVPAFGRVEPDALSRDGLPGSKSISSGLNGVGRGYKLFLSALFSHSHTTDKDHTERENDIHHSSPQQRW